MYTSLSMLYKLRNERFRLSLQTGGKSVGLLIGDAYKNAITGKQFFVIDYIIINNSLRRRGYFKGVIEFLVKDNVSVGFFKLIPPISQFLIRSGFASVRLYMAETDRLLVGDTEPMEEEAIESTGFLGPRPENVKNMPLLLSPAAQKDDLSYIKWTDRAEYEKRGLTVI